jgi:TetR/AcrR family transcriptional regulator, transcriptional repressor for nem operon
MTSDATRERILEAAVGLFNRQGFSGVSMSALMEAAGLQKGGLYWHFGSKEEIALAAFDHAVGKIRRRLAGALNGPVPAAERLHAFIDAFHGFYEDPPLPGGCAVMNTAIESDDGSPALRERALGAMRSLLDALERLVVDAREAGVVPGLSEPRAVASLMVATLEGSLAISRLCGDRRHLDAAADHLHRLVRMETRTAPGRPRGAPITHTTRTGGG